MMIDERVNEFTALTTYLESLAKVQQSGYNCNREISEVIKELRTKLGLNNADVSELYKRYIRRIFLDCGESYSEDKALVNAQIFYAYISGKSGELYFRRCSGVTTSILALMKVFDDVVYVKSPRDSVPGVAGKVVFLEGGAKLPRGTRPRSVIKIRSIDVIDTKPLLDGGVCEIAHVI
jgi:hypothetical protein